MSSLLLLSLLGCPPPPLPDDSSSEDPPSFGPEPHPEEDSGTLPPQEANVLVEGGDSMVGDTPLPAPVAATRLAASEEEACTWAPGYPTASCVQAGTVTALAGGWREIVTTDSWGCGLTTTSHTYCWGEGFPALAEVSLLTLTTNGTDMLCGITAESYVQCWGEDVDVLFSTHLAREIAWAGEMLCLLTISGSIACFDPRTYEPGEGRSTAFSITGSYVHLFGGDEWCALTTTQDMTCGDGSTWTHADPFLRGHAKNGAFCGQVGEQILCWNSEGSNPSGAIDWALREDGPLVLTREGLQ